MKNTETTSPKTISHLFSDMERKTILKHYLIFMGIIEIFILIFCWFYQLGTQDYDRFGPVDIPFPWRIYFLLAFLTPIVITFLMGIFLMAFNKYLAGYEDKTSLKREKKISENENRFETIVQTIFNIPFLLALFLVAIGAGIIYRIDDIVGYLQRLGEQSIQFLLILLCATLGIGTLFGLTWMIFAYKLKKKSMEYEFKTQIMEQFGIAVLEDNTMITRSGQLLSDEKKDLSVHLLTHEKTIQSESLDTNTQITPNKDC
jgi:uncharacterized integral membrane protein